MDLARVQRAVSAYQTISWREFMTASIPGAQGYLSRFEAIVNVGPTEDRSVLQSMVHHEAAILKWVKMESSGITQGSLDDVIAQLEHPLPVLT